MLASITSWFDGISHARVMLAVCASVATFLLSTGVMMAVLLTLPHDYFAGPTPPSRSTPGRRGVLDWPYRIGKNLAGLALLVLGLVMAVPGVPGQGILTMFTGLLLLDFPGQYALVRRLLGRPSVLRSINHLRARFDKPSLSLGPQSSASGSSGAGIST